MDPLKQYLEQQRSAGQVDSSGGFTIAWEQAREKLRQFQMHSPSHYVLKLVQAAVAAGAEQVDFKLSRNEAVCFFFLPEDDQQLELEALAEALAQQPSDDSPRRHLAVALNASLATDPVQVIWGVWQPTQMGPNSRAVVVTDDCLETVHDLPYPVKDEPGWSRKLYYFRLERKRRISVRGAGSEHALLAERCGYAAATIRVDGKALDTPVFGIDNTAWHEQYSKSYLLLRRLDTEEPCPLGASISDPADWQLQEPFRVYEKPVLVKLRREPYLWRLQPDQGLLADQRRIACRSLVSLPLNMEGPSRLLLIRHGVALDALAIDCSFAAEVVLPAEGLKVDLSEFAAIADDQLEKKQTQALELLAAVGAELQKVDELPLFNTDVLGGNEALKIAGCCVLGWLGVPFMLWQMAKAAQEKKSHPAKIVEGMHQRAWRLERVNR